MKSVDSFRRTPLRRYTESRRRESRLEHAGKFRKRYFEMPQDPGRKMRGAAIRACICIILILVFCNGSAPLDEVPSATERFQQWAQIHNKQVIEALPGNTPEPGSELHELLLADSEDEQARIEEAMAQGGANSNLANQAEITEEGFKHYEPGDLGYHTERMDVEILQKQKDGMTYFVCDIRISDVSQLRTAFAGDDFRSGIYEAVSDIARRNSPVLAVNGDFCRYHRKGVIIRNGELLRKQNITRHHLLIIDEEGNMSAETDRSGKQGLVADRLAKANTWQTFEFGPVLVENYEAAKLPGNFYVNCHDGYYEPRTAIGQVGPLHYLVIVVDGRREGYSTGASIPQLQQLFLDEGVQFAFNLDGGGSTSLYFLGEVINMPSGGKERSVSDIVMFMPNPI